jgi:protein SCO1/2
MDTSTAPPGARAKTGPNRWVWIGTALVFAVAAFVATVLAYTHARIPAFAGTPADGAPAPDFVLQDQDGKPFTLAAQHGNAVVLFFGYAHCPDVCPTTLANLERAKHLLGPQAQAHVTVAFVTVDPDRDTQHVLKRYVALFDPAFYGLTGDTAALDGVYGSYHVWHQKLPSKDSGDYLMAHTSEIYLIDPDGRLRVFHDYTDTPAAIAHDLEILTS